MDMIEQLPDFPRLEQLAAALWRQPGGGPGAALMVGAGFSRNCKRVTPEAPLPPLWPELLDRMSAKLSQPGVGSGTTDPLRMAEEFRAFFGQSALDDFIRTNVPDGQWLPDEAHKALVELPWSDILTTNWDTLIERAARTCSRHNYAPVLRGTDLAHTRSPRIIKLHGTVGDGGGYVFAEEDYRRYATRHAALVNAARQVFIENEVCLLGFSGDDPNFLQWTGWVRDQLGSATRRIYLVGVLSLSRAARQLLESRNIAPIDLAELVSTSPSAERHGRAAGYLLDYLRRARESPPQDWTPASVVPMEVDERHMVTGDAATKASRLKILVGKLAAEREAYPGWLVAPVALHRAMDQQVSSIEGIIHTGEREPDWGDPLLLLKAKLELAWRLFLGMSSITAAVRRMLANAWEAAQQEPFGRLATRFIAPLMLRDARERRQGPAFRRWALRLEGSGDAELIAHAAYERAQLARDREDWHGLELLQALVVGPDPGWQLRRAGLLFDLGRSEEASALLERTLEDVREQMASARDSVWLRSRRAWCQWLLYYAKFEDKTSPHRSNLKDLQGEAPYRCNPADDVREITRLVADAALESNDGGESVLPGFKPGSYQTIETPSVSPSRWGTSAGARYARFRNASALALWVGGISLEREADMLARLMLPAHPLSLASLWPYLASTEMPRQIERVIARVTIARLSTRQARLMKRRLWDTLHYWLKRLRPNTPLWRQHPAPIWGAVVILGRLTPRLPENDVLDLWHLSVRLARENNLSPGRTDRRILELANLAGEALSGNAKAALALDVVQQPYVGEYGPEHPAREIESHFYTFLRSAPSATKRGPMAGPWQQRIAQIIEGLERPTARAAAARLLLELHLDKALSRGEASRFSEAIWREREPSGLPARLNLVPNFLALLPVPRDVDLRGILQRALLPTAAPVMSHEYLRMLEYAGMQRLNLQLSPDAARRALRHLNDAVAQYVGGDPTMFEPSTGDVRSAVGVFLGRTVLSRISHPTDSDINEALRAIRTLNMPAVLEGLTQHLRAARQPHQEDILHLIQAHLLSKEWQCVAAACKAIAWWIPEPENTRTERLQSYPHQLTTTLLAAIDALHDGVVHVLLQTARKLIDAKLLDAASRKRLTAAVPVILELYDYRNMKPLTPRTIEVSLVRRECGLLIRVLLEHDDSALLQGHIDELISDPLPEVRNALLDS